MMFMSRKNKNFKKSFMDSKGGGSSIAEISALDMV